MRQAISRRLRDRTTWLVLLSLLIVLSAARVREEKSNTPLDPKSTAPDGTKALTLLLGQLGAHVSVGTSLDKAGVVLLLSDDLARSQRDDLNTWIDEGGTLVVADPGSAFAIGGGSGELRRPGELAPRCSSSLTSGVDHIAPASRRGYELLKPRDLDESCFTVGDGAFMVIGHRGGGTIIELGGPDVFTNERLGKADNSVLVANLLAGKQGERVTLLQADESKVSGDGSREHTLSDLIPNRVRQALWQLIMAGLLLMLWRGRRLGRPVEEVQAVEIPASALVVAVGDLLQNAQQADGAAHILRSDLRRNLAALVGLPSDVDPVILARVVAERTGIDEWRLQATLLDHSVPDARALLELAQEIEAVHREVAHAR